MNDTHVIRHESGTYYTASKAADELRAMDFAATWGMADANY